MDTTYVCGHRNPDTDSIVSAIAYAALRNALGDNGYVAARLGHLNDETTFILNRFGAKAPVLLSTVRTQVRDIDFDHPPQLGRSVPVSHAWEVLQSGDGFTALPVTRENGSLFGVLTAGGIAERDMESIRRPAVEDVPVFNLLSALEGRIINDDENLFESVSGEVVIALPGAGEPLRGVKPDSIVICGQQEDVLERAELIGIIDHHRLADVQTGYPVFMRNEPVGSTATIIATMFQEHGILPGEQLAGLLAAAILSDTVMFKSPTATPRDRRIAERMAHIAGLDLEALGMEIFSASQSQDKPADALLGTDFKEFHLAGHALGISQITTMDSKGMMRRAPEFLEEMEKRKTRQGYDMMLLMITDVLKEGTWLLFTGDREIIRQAFAGSSVKENRVFLPGVVSRKKQVVPALSVLWG